MSTPEEIRNARKSLRVSQFSMAKVSGISRVRLSLIETGQLDPNPEESAAIRKALAHFAGCRYDEVAAIRAEIAAPAGVQISA